MHKTPPQGVEILSVEAKDLYLSNNLIDNNPIGYNVRYRKGELNNELIIKKFINTFDYSLDFIHWEKIRGRHISTKECEKFFEKENHRYTLDFINVTFDYSVKLYNKVGTYYVKLGHEINDEIESELMSNGVYTVNDEIIAVDSDYDVIDPIEERILGKYFFYNIETNKYCAKNNIPTILSGYELRDWIYKNGFICDGRKYVRYKRSSGSSRVGKCLFIDERLYESMHNYELMGLNIKEEDEIDLASFEAYISLTLSSIIDTIEIEPKNILVIDDYESIFNEVCVDTTNIDGKLVTREKEVEICNSIWDGQSLMDKSLFCNYEKYGMLLLRNRFFKSCCFNTNIQQWFEDNGITEVSQLNGYTLAEDISDVKLITTPSSVKYLKFGSLENWLKQLESTFGVVKHEKKTHHLNGNCVSTHYQLLNTLQMSKEEVAKFLKEPFDYIRKIREQPAVLRNHIRYSMYNYDFDKPFLDNNDITYKLLGINSDFSKTKMYEKFKKDIYDSYIKDMRLGHILITGNYETLCGNPIEMLNQSIGKFNGIPYMHKETVYSKRFEDGEELIGSRSPHVCAGCILISKNKRYELIDKYCNFTNEIIGINSINENILMRLSGCDFDSDTLLLTNNKIILETAKRNYCNFRVSTNSVHAKKIKRKYNNHQKADMDYKTSKNQIGSIVNLSQILNSIMWNRINNGDTVEDVKEIIYDINQLNVMSGIEIDSAKKEFDIDNPKELKDIREKYEMRNQENIKIKPYFFYYILKEKELLDNNTDFKKFDTTMDYLEEYIDNVIRKKGYRYEYQKKYIDLYDVLETSNYDYSRVNRNQVKIIKEILEKYNDSFLNIYSNTNLSNYGKYKQSLILKFTYLNRINKFKLNNSTMIFLLKTLDKDNYKHLYKRCFNLLFCEENSKFTYLIKYSKDKMPKLKYDNDGDINLLGFRYKLN